MSKSVIDQKFWNRWKVLFEALSTCFLYFPISYSHIIHALHSLLPVFTEVKHFLRSYFSLWSSFLLNSLERKQPEDGSGIVAIVRWRGAPYYTSIHRSTPPGNCLRKKSYIPIIVIIMCVCIMVRSLQNTFTYISSIELHNSWSRNNRFSIHMNIPSIQYSCESL